MKKNLHPKLPNISIQSFLNKIDKSFNDNLAMSVLAITLIAFILFRIGWKVGRFYGL